MKKIGFLVIALALTIGVTTSCKKEKDCAQVVQDAADAAQDFATNFDQASCEAYKDAVEDFMDGCLDGQSQVVIDAYQSFLDNTDCGSL